MAIQSADVQANLVLLESRLRRLEFLFTGSSDLDGHPDGIEIPQTSDDTITGRIAKLQASLDRLRRLDGPAGNLVREVDALHYKFPELRKPNPTVATQGLSTQASVVLSHATTYPETASRLSSLQSLPIPAAESSTKISDLAPKIAECQRTQTELEEEVQDLRQRSAKCLEWWVKVGVVGMDDLWEEWEDRVKDTQRRVARLERQQKEREGYL